MIDRPDAAEAPPPGLCLDKGYDYREVYELLEELGFSAHIRSRGEEAKAIEREAGFRAAGSSSAPTPGSTASAAC